MEQTALRPKPMPGRDPGGSGPADRENPARPRTAHRRGRRLVRLLVALGAGLVLVLAGFGLGAVGATVGGMNGLAELQRQAAARQPPGTTAPDGAREPAAPPAAAAPAALPRGGAVLGLEAVDDPGPGARVVGVHDPGPGHAAGLAPGDILLTFGTTRVDTAADLARAVSRARPGTPVRLVVRHRGGAFRQVTVVPGVVT